MLCSGWLRVPAQNASRTGWVLAVGAAFGACGVADPSPPEVASVVVSPSLDTIAAIGGTVLLSAEAVDQCGNAVPGADFAWTSGDESVATVDAGLVTAVDNGQTAIVVESGETTGFAQTGSSRQRPR